MNAHRPKFPDEERIVYDEPEAAKSVMTEFGVLDKMTEESRKTEATAVYLVGQHATHYCICIVEAARDNFQVVALRKKDTTREKVQEMLQELLDQGEVISSKQWAIPVENTPLQFPEEQTVITDPAEAKAVLFRLGVMELLERQSATTRGSSMILHSLHPTHWCACVVNTFNSGDPLYLVAAIRKSAATKAEVEAVLRDLADSMAPIEEDPSAGSN